MLITRDENSDLAIWWYLSFGQSYLSLIINLLNQILWLFYFLFDDFSPLSSYNPLYLIMKSYLEKHFMQKVKTEPEKT